MRVLIENVGDTSSASIAENTTTVATYTVTDLDAGDTVSWSLSGDDADLFEINSSGELKFKNAPDYETPLGGLSDNSNTYSLTVEATDSAGLEDNKFNCKCNRNI